MKPKLIIGNKNYSTWSLRPWLLMKEAGIEFDEHRILLDTPTMAKEIAEFSDAGKVPILQLGDVTVWDSLAIAETVAERWPEKKLWPEDPGERAHARAISAEMHSGFAHLRNCMPMNCRAMGRKVHISDELGDDINRIMEIWAECHKHYGDRGGWLFGDFSVAEDQIQTILELNPNSPLAARAHLARGQLLLSRGATEAAVADFRQALELDPQLAAAQAALARLRGAGKERG